MKKAIPGTARQVLGLLNAKQLSWLSGMNQKKDMENLIDITRKIVDYERDVVFAIRENSPNLAVEHAFGRGHAAMVTVLVYLFEGAEEELKDRKKENRGTKKKSDTLGG